MALSTLRGAWDRSRILRTGTIVIALLGLSVWSTWPLVPHLGQFVNEDDPYASAWGLWWVAHAVTHPQNPWYTHHILAPDGSYLSFHALFPLLGLLASPLTLTLGAAITYNILKVLLGPLAAATAYALGRSLGLPRAASWVMGALWGFSIITEWRTAYHVNFGAGMVLLPLVMTFAVRYERLGARRDALLLGLTLAATLLVDPTMTLFGVMALALWVVVNGLRGRGWRHWVVGLAWAASVTVVVGSPQLIMMANAARAGGYTPNLTVLAATWTGADTNLHTMLSPGNVRSWFPGALEHEAYKYPWGEATPAYGWGALVLGLGGFLSLVAAVGRRLVPMLRRQPAAAGSTVDGPEPAGDAPGPTASLGRRTVAWGVAVFLLGSLFALGPELTLTRHPYVPVPFSQHGQRLSAVMPYTWLVQFPLFEDVRVPARFVMLGQLGLVVVAGYGAVALWRRRVWGQAIVVLALAFAFVESGFPDGGAAKSWVPLKRSSLYAPIRADGSQSTVVDIPLAFIGATDGVGRTPGKLEPMLRATQNGGHPIAEGFVTRLSTDTITRLTQHPFYAAVLANQGSAPEDAAPLPAPDVHALRADIHALRVGWVVLWPSASRRVPSLLRTLGFSPVLRQDGIVLYRAPR